MFGAIYCWIVEIKAAGAQINRGAHREISRLASPSLFNLLNIDSK